MTEFTQEDWLEFEAMVEANGPSTISSSTNDIMFRGSDEKITLEYVRAPFEDSIIFAELLEKDPEQFKDAGFHTILPIAKSLEMHIRLLALGSEKERFENPDFHLSRCLKMMQKMRKDEIGTSENFEGFNKSVPFSGEHLTNFMLQDPKQCSRMIKKAFMIYGQGNPYRHNQVKSWTEIKSEYKEIRKAFKQFSKIFGELVG